jgi:hypothetical protein
MCYFESFCNFIKVSFPSVVVSAKKDNICKAIGILSRKSFRASYFGVQRGTYTYAQRPEIGHASPKAESSNGSLGVKFIHDPSTCLYESTVMLI